jgi:hypothetical protein
MRLCLASQWRSLLPWLQNCKLMLKGDAFSSRHREQDQATSASATVRV